MSIVLPRTPHVIPEALDVDGAALLDRVEGHLKAACSAFKELKDHAKRLEIELGLCVERNEKLAMERGALRSRVKALEKKVALGDLVSSVSFCMGFVDDM